MPSAQRGISVIISAVLLIIAAMLTLFYGAAMIDPGATIAAIGASLLFTMVAIPATIMAVLLWFAQAWSHRAMKVITIAWIILSLYLTIFTYVKHRGLYIAVVPALILWYLHNKDVKKFYHSK